MPIQETGKDKSQRIELDYHRQRDGLGKLKIALALLGLAVGATVFGFALVDSNAANPGPLAEGHAGFEDNCAACHQALTPIGQDAVRNLSLVGIDERDSVAHTFDACTRCHHTEADPIANHFRSEMSGDWSLLDKNCAICHVDHQGRDHSLTRISSDLCSRCHAQLGDVCPDGRRVQDQSITSFVDDHADFRSLQREDPGSVTFDHAQHLLPGQAGIGKESIRLSDLEPEMRQRYRRKMMELKTTDPQFAELDTGDDALVQLDCSSCHQLAGGFDGQISQAADLEMGRYFQPVSFEKHCAACHSMNPAGRGDDTLPIPHAAPWSELEQWLAAKIARYRRGSPANPTGIGLDPSAHAEDDPEPGQPLAEAWRKANLEASKEMLKEQCRKCHQEQLIRDDASIMAARDADAEPLIPNRWLAQGIYDHAAHRRIECRYCHQQVFAAGTPDQPGRDQQTVMIAGMESCVGCHRPAETPTPAELLEDGEPDPVFGGQSLWASDRCTMCHRYHVSDHASVDLTGVAKSGP